MTAPNDWLYADFPPQDDRLYQLCRDYHMRCEMYDQLVCTGPVGPDGATPADYRELGLINRNAFKVREEILDRGEAMGFDRAELVRALKRFRP